MQSLYRETDHRYTPEADELDRRAATVIRPLFNEFVQKGFSPREIAHILQGCVTEWELEHVIGWANNDDGGHV